MSAVIRILSDPAISYLCKNLMIDSADPLSNRPEEGQYHYQ